MNATSGLMPSSNLTKFSIPVAASASPYLFTRPTWVHQPHHTQSVTWHSFVLTNHSNIIVAYAPCSHETATTIPAICHLPSAICHQCSAVRRNCLFAHTAQHSISLPLTYHNMHHFCISCTSDVGGPLERRHLSEL